jgi:hypothetical protein
LLVFSFTSVFTVCGLILSAQTTEPVTNWGVFLGGSGDDDSGNAITDASGNVYVVGSVSAASSNGLPNPLNTFKGGNSDAILTKLNSQGNPLFSMFIGGNGNDAATALSLTDEGEIIVAGNTSSTLNLLFNAPQGAQMNYGGGSADGFVAKISSSGELIWNVYFGGAGNDLIRSVSTSSQGKIAISGKTSSANFSCSPNAYQTFHAGGAFDGIAAILDDMGNISWTSYLGGQGSDEISGVSFNQNNEILMAGTLSGSDCDFFSDATYHGGNTDAFLIKSDGQLNLLWKKYIGGSGDETALSVVTDLSGQIVVGGKSSSPNFPSVGSSSSFAGGNYDAFVVRYSTSGISLWSTLYGGLGDDRADAVHVNFLGQVYAAITTNSAGLSQINQLNTSIPSANDALIAKWSNNGSLEWSQYLGGAGDDEVTGIYTDNQNNVVTTGSTAAISFNGADITNQFQGGTDVFAAQLSDCVAPVVQIHASGDTIFCEGKHVTFCVAGADHFLWSNGDTTMSTQVDTTMAVYCIGTTNAGCSAISNRINTLMMPKPEVILAADGPTIFCDSASVWLHASGAVSYEWNYNHATGDSLLAVDSLDYTVTGIGENGCADVSEVVSVRFVGHPDVLMAISTDTTCISTPNVPMIALPEGGTFSGDGIEGSDFIPSLAGGGNHVITYTYVDENGCEATTEPSFINVQFVPTVLVAMNDSACVSDGPIALTGTPAGGVFTGDAVMNNMFYPQVAGPGDHQVQYKYLDENGCMNTASQVIHVSSCLSVGDEIAQWIQVWPNPANQYFYLQSTNGQPTQYWMYNATGQLVKSGTAYTRMQISTQGFAQGIYTLTTQQKNEFTSVKIAVE